MAETAIFGSKVIQPELEILRRHRFVSKFQLQTLGPGKQRSHFLLQRLLAFLDPFVVTAGFALLFAFLVPFFETYAFGMFPAFSSRLIACDPVWISLVCGGLFAELPLLKPSLPFARNFKLQDLFCSNSTVSGPAI
jgi:hypothetical protein